ncbi:hypothetical protein Tco_0366263 [Tanacetum coccineum]
MGPNINGDEHQEVFCCPISKTKSGHDTCRLHELRKHPIQLTTCPISRIDGSQVISEEFWPHVQVVVALSRSSRKEVQVRISVFSGTLLEEYCWNDRHGIEKTFCPVADSLEVGSLFFAATVIVDVGGIEMRRLEEIRIRSGSYGGVPMGFGFE